MTVEVMFISKGVVRIRKSKKDRQRPIKYDKGQTTIYKYQAETKKSLKISMWVIRTRKTKRDRRNRKKDKQ
jgi:hypothetical protein